MGGSTRGRSTDWGPLQARLHQRLRRTTSAAIGSPALLSPGQALLVAVSGGQDSLCLARLLLDLQPHWRWRLAIAHCNHRWRTDADANAAHVAHLAEVWQLPYFERIAVDPPGSEAAARTWRYQVLGELAQSEGFEAVVTGHTASDRAETLLHNLIRGSGADGLGSLPWQRPLAPGIRLVRPLLDLTRQETAAFCQAANLPVWEDSTNQALQYRRNRLRLAVLPYLRKHFNPRVDEHLAQTAELLQADVAYLEQQATQLRQETETEQGLNRRLLAQAPLALQRRVVRQVLGQHLGRSPNYAQIEKVVALLTAPNHSQTDPFPGGAIAVVQGDWVVFQSKR